MPAQTRAMAQAINEAKQQHRPRSRGKKKFQARPKPRARTTSHVKIKIESVDSTKPKIKTEPIDNDEVLLASESPSGLLNIAPEIRLAIFKLCLPQNENLILDPHPSHNSHYVPHAFRKPCYQATGSLLLVSRQVHAEVVPIIYTCNTLTLLQPLQTPFLERKLPRLALQSVREVEVCMVKSLIELGGVFNSCRVHMPAATSLRLNFYHCDEILSCLGELAWRSWTSRSFKLKTELYKSVWPDDQGPPYGTTPMTHHTINNAINLGSFAAAVYDMKVPKQLKTITVTVSAAPGAADAFMTFRNWHTNEANFTAITWRFNKDGNKDTAECKYLVWEDEKQS